MTYSITGDGIPHYERKRNGTKHSTRHQKKQHTAITTPFSIEFSKDHLLDYLPSLDYDDYLENIDKYASIDLEEWLRTTNSSFLYPENNFSVPTQGKYFSSKSKLSFAPTALPPLKSKRINRSYSRSSASGSIPVSRAKKFRERSTFSSPSPFSTNEGEISLSLSTSGRSQPRSGSKSRSSVILSPAFSVDLYNGTVFVMMVSSKKQS